MNPFFALGTIRAGPFVVVPDVLREFGVDPDPLIAAAGLLPGALESTETPISYAAAGRLLALAAERTGCVHFGLRVGQRAGIAALGVLGMVMQNSPTALAVLETMSSHFRRHDGGAALMLRVEQTVASISYQALEPCVPGSEQIADGALAVGVQILRSLWGLEWCPVEASVARPRPIDPAPWHALVRAPLHFDADSTSLSFDPTCVNRPLRHAHPAVHALLLEFMTTPQLSNASAPGADLCDAVRQVLRTRITYGDASLASVASDLGLRPRALHRQLASLGVTFKELMNEIRFEAARQLLEQTTMPLGRISSLLGYTELSSFTRSFRTRAGMPPALWRAKQRLR